MFSNFLSKGAQVISNGARVISLNTSSSNINVNIITKQILTKLQNTLAKQLGQNIDCNIQSLFIDQINDQQLQKTIIQTKQKYHQLLSQLEIQNQSIKIMVQSILEFMKNLSNSLQNQDMLTPLKDLQSAFYVCNTNKVEKQVKYFWKLYQAALNDYLKIHVNSKSDQCKDEVNLFKGLNKNLQVELFRSRNNCLQLQKKVSDLHFKSQQMNQKIQILQKLGSQSAILSSSKQKQKMQQHENQLLDKIKSLQRQKQKLQRINRDNENELNKINLAIEVVKNNQDSIIDDMKKQIMKKQITYQSSIHKMCLDKVNLQEKITINNLQLQTLIAQNRLLKDRQSNIKKQPKISQIKQLTQKIKQLQQQNRQIKKTINQMINKQIMKALFLGFQDQSKQWTIRRDVKNQIYSLLGIKYKIDSNQIKNYQKKWFGFF